MQNRQDGESERRSIGTIDAANAMSAQELATFLGERREARLATVRQDGDVHLTPVWYLYENERFHFCLERRRLHLRNLRRTPRATVLVDQDFRTSHGWRAGAKATMASGAVELIEDQPKVEVLHARLLERYYGDAVSDPEFQRTSIPELRFVLAILTPDRILAWDFSKG
jgi:PPOX class probable F420-dependent enzyme